MRSSRKRTARRREKLRCTTAGGVDPRIISQQVDSITRACARDYNGVEIKRQLNGFGALFALMVEAIALGLCEDGSFERTWADPQARRLATMMIFLGYECQETRFHGEAAWVVRGYSVRTLGSQTTVRFCANAIYDADGKPRGAHVNTLSRDIRKLMEDGFLVPEKEPHSHQFDAKKLIAQGKGWCVGPPKKNPDGSPMLDKNGVQMQYSFNHYFIPFCPFAPGTRGRVKPGKFDHPFRSKQSTGEHPTPASATTPQGRVEDAKQYARDQVDAVLRAQLGKRDEISGSLPWAGLDSASRPALEPRLPVKPEWENPARMAQMIALSGSDPPNDGHS